MELLVFQDDDLGVLHDIINKLQICFHHIYAPSGHFSIDALFELQKRNVRIIADRNIVSPICEIATKGKIKDTNRMKKIALFVIWTKYIGAQLSSGLGLYENDTTGLSTISGEENRLQFLHGVDLIPPQFWKMIAFGQIDEIPQQYLFKKQQIKNIKYDFNNNLLYLCNKAAIIKIVQLIRTDSVSGVDRFLSFMDWYVGHMDIAESMVFYAACVFMEVNYVSKPKGCNSPNYQKVIAGVKNQAWDITYISAWSTQYRNEKSNDITMFATDDITQKVIVVNILPPGECGNALSVVFADERDYKRVSKFFDERLGASRIQPFSCRKKEDNINLIKELIEKEITVLQTMFK